MGKKEAPVNDIVIVDGLWGREKEDG